MQHTQRIRACQLLTFHLLHLCVQCFNLLLCLGQLLPLLTAQIHREMVCVCVGVRACVCACVCVRVCARTQTNGSTQIACNPPLHMHKPELLLE